MKREREVEKNNGHGGQRELGERSKDVKNTRSGD